MRRGGFIRAGFGFQYSHFIPRIDPRVICLMQDYTMAQYRPETFEVLAHTETVKKLVQRLGYPEVGVE